MNKRICGIMLAALVAASGAQAAVISTDYVPQSGGWFSSEIGNLNRQARNISNDSFDTENANNPDPGPGHTNLPSDSMWLTSVPGFGGTDSDPFVIIDLGAEYVVGTSFHVWNYNELSGFATRGTRAVEILSSTGARTNAGDGPPLPETFVSRGTFEFAQAPGTAGYLGESYSFSAPFTARYLKLDINSNWGGDGYGLSEIQFTQVIPEPASLALVGLGVLGLLRRRRHSA